MSEFKMFALFISLLIIFSYFAVTYKVVVDVVLILGVIGLIASLLKR
jgi:hypothetical protein